ncbi:hypothetical protein [Nitrosophilus labii]|uniref:hypothetical protein n=1 Tax=Nitrosophilus labii TaxID=2706014 RepID=UPI00165721B7|nr:hypothetical protein [Nitrosophilus labii]
MQLYAIMDNKGIIYTDTSYDDIELQFRIMLNGGQSFVCNDCGYVDTEDFEVCPACESEDWQGNHDDINWEGDLKLIQILKVAK